MVESAPPKPQGYGRLKWVKVLGKPFINKVITIIMYFGFVGNLHASTLLPVYATYKGPSKCP